MEVNLLSEDRRKGKITVEEAGRMGGEKTSKTRGPEFYSAIGSKGGSQRAKQHEGSLEARGKNKLGRGRTPRRTKGSQANSS
jgi:general stress protein YciG